MSNYNDKLNELKEFLINKSNSEFQNTQLRFEMNSIKEQLQAQFLNLFEDIYSYLKSNIAGLDFSRNSGKDDYYGDLSAEYKIGNFQVNIKFNSLDCDLMEAILEIDNEVDEIGDEFLYELVKHNNQWLWLRDDEILSGELLLDDVMSAMMESIVIDI